MTNASVDERIRPPAVEFQMTPREFREARHALGLSVRQLAEMLSLEPEIVRRMEMEIGDGAHRPVRGAVLRLLRAYLDGYRPPDWPVGT